MILDCVTCEMLQVMFSTIRVLQWLMNVDNFCFWQNKQTFNFKHNHEF